MAISKLNACSKGEVTERDPTQIAARRLTKQHRHGWVFLIGPRILGSSTMFVHTQRHCAVHGQVSSDTYHPYNGEGITCKCSSETRACSSTLFLDNSIALHLNQGNTGLTHCRTVHAKKKRLEEGYTSPDISNYTYIVLPRNKNIVNQT